MLASSLMGSRSSGSRTRPRSFPPVFAAGRRDNLDIFRPVDQYQYTPIPITPSPTRPITQGRALVRLILPGVSSASGAEDSTGRKLTVRSSVCFSYSIVRVNVSPCSTAPISPPR